MGIKGFTNLEIRDERDDFVLLDKRVDVHNKDDELIKVVENQN